MECFICMVKAEGTMLFDAVLREGVVKVCEDCSVKEGIPIIRKISKLQLKESEKNQTVYEKLSRMAGLDPEEHKAKFGRGIVRLRTQNKDLRKIVEEKSELSFPGLKQIKVDVKSDLIRNYHWAILQARRARRVTQRQFAEAIAEPEASIKLIERGILPDNYHSFIRKIQTYLGITIFSKPVKKQLGFNSVSSKSLTISDLQEIKDKVNEEKSSSFFPYWKKKLGFLRKKREKKIEEYVDLKEIGSKQVQALSSDGKQEMVLEDSKSEIKVEGDFEPKDDKSSNESSGAKAETKVTDPKGVPSGEESATKAESIVAEESATKSNELSNESPGAKANELSNESSEENLEETRESGKEKVKEDTGELSKEEMDKIIFGKE